MGPKNGVRFITNMMIPISDGVRLAMDMHFPDSDDWEQTPRLLILEFIPYRKDDTACSTMTIDIRLLVEEGSMVLILLGPFVSMLGVIIIIERPMAIGPDPKSTAVLERHHRYIRPHRGGMGGHQYGRSQLSVGYCLREEGNKCHEFVQGRRDYLHPEAARPFPKFKDQSRAFAQSNLRHRFLYTSSYTRFQHSPYPPHYTF